MNKRAFVIEENYGDTLWIVYRDRAYPFSYDVDEDDATQVRFLYNQVKDSPNGYGSDTIKRMDFGTVKKEILI